MHLTPRDGQAARDEHVGRNGGFAARRDPVVVDARDQVGRELRGLVRIQAGGPAVAGPGRGGRRRPPTYRAHPRVHAATRVGARRRHRREPQRAHQGQLVFPEPAGAPAGSRNGRHLLQHDGQGAGDRRDGGVGPGGAVVYPELLGPGVAGRENLQRGAGI